MANPAKMNFYQRKKEIHGVTYTAQFSGLSTALRAVDENHIDGTDAISNEKLYNYIFENVIVDPKVTIDDFEDLDVMNEVVKWAQEVMKGKFRDEPAEPASKA